jgi:hypothetical protein
MPAKLSTEIFIQKAKQIHNNKYDYSKVNYIGYKIKVCIICPIHGEFLQEPSNHLMQKGCSKCAKILLTQICNENNKRNTIPFQIIVDRFNRVHNNFYQYIEPEIFKGYRQKIEIICPTHGSFLQQVQSHLNGKGCPECHRFSLFKTQQQFIKECQLLYGNDFDYSLTIYNGIFENIIVKCNSCENVFNVIAHNHLLRGSCKYCGLYYGEKEISKFLTKFKISFILHKWFKDCRNIYPLPFDFYLPDYNTCIEFDGRQHYKPVCFGGISLERANLNFQRTKTNDQIKNEYCLQNNIRLLRIPHWEFKNIDSILEKELISPKFHHLG